jgi:hypothetical protein
MKKTPSNIRTPRRSTSMVSTMTRPIIEQKQYEKTVSPTSSFSSSILARGMSESMTPQKTYHLSRTNVTEDQKNILLPKSNRRRAIDFSRRRTVAGPTEQINNNNNNKENFPINRRQQIYRFSPSTSNNIVTKKYYFHSNPPVKTEDILMNSYGLTLLQQQKRQSIPASMMIPNMSENISIRSPPKQLNHRPSIYLTQSQYTSDSLEDLLCDREVESYFYPNRQQAPTSHVQHIYINLETPPNYYQPTAYLHGTLC